MRSKQIGSGGGRRGCLGVPRLGGGVPLGARTSLPWLWGDILGKNDLGSTRRIDRRERYVF